MEAPKFLQDLFTRSTKNAPSGNLPVNTFEGITSRGEVVLRDSRGTRRAQIPETSEKGFAVANALAIYKPDGGKSVDAAKAMANFTGWTFAAVNAIASEVANIDLRLYRAEGKNHTELDQHELLDLLDNPNEHMTGIELKYTMMAHLELAGNFFGYLDGVSGQTGQPTAIYPLSPGRMQVKVTGGFPKKLSHYEYTEDGNVYRFQPWQILHIKYPDPNDPFVGIGIPQTIPVWIDADNYAMEYNRKFFVNGAALGLYLATQTNVEGQIERLKTSFRNEHTGVENAHKVPVLPKGVDLKQTGMTHRDMDFSNLVNTTRDQILAGFRVSKTILGTAESDTNRSTAETADYVFAKRTIKPKMQLVVSYLNAFLVPRYEDNLYLTFIDPTPEDKAFRTEEMQAAVGSMPVMTQNEARENYLGLGPVEGGDKLMRPTAMEPAGETDTPEGEDLAPGAAAEGPTKNYSRLKTAEGWQTSPFRVQSIRQSPAKKLGASLLESFRKHLDRTPAFQVKSFNELTHDEYLQHWKRFDERSRKAEAELQKVFDGINAKQKAEVLENLPDATAITKDVGELYDLKEWIGITINLAGPILTQLAKDEAAAAFAMIGAQHQDILANPGIREALERGIAKMARSYNETTLDQLEKVLGDKLTQPGGTNLAELTEAVEGVYDFADATRAGRIAQTEAYRASNWANKEAWKASGVVKTVRLYTAEDDHVCQYCDAIANEGPIDINTNFAEAGAKIIGTDGGVMTADYGDIEAPPIHVLCRCYLRPDVISTD